MATRQMHRIAGKPYNLLKKVEIPVELQVKDHGAFLNEFSSQPTPGQSGTKSDTEMILNLTLMHLLMTVVVIQITTLSYQNIEWMLSYLKGHHLLNGCRIRQVRIKLCLIQRFCLN